MKGIPYWKKKGRQKMANFFDRDEFFADNLFTNKSLCGGLI